jgi:hypothetical protein
LINKPAWRLYQGWFLSVLGTLVVREEHVLVVKMIGFIEFKQKNENIETVPGTRKYILNLGLGHVIGA